MRLENHEPSTVGVNGSNFGFANNSKIIDIVINKMYQNKPGAVIRELASNAWDAHLAAGVDRPFVINLPTWLNKGFSIQDFGTGIPHDSFEKIYTNIGGSTKDDSNDLIGGFGLGSKTPFSMVDQFTVSNVCDGEVSLWLCYKDAGQPKVKLLKREETSEHSGVTVSFAFQQDYEYEFTQELTKQLKFFPVKPEVHGGTQDILWDKLPEGWETQDYFYTGEKGYGVTHSVVMGGVNYELDPRKLGYQGVSIDDLLYYELVIKCDIGEVDIPPSRETLEYTERTKKFIVGKLQEIREDYKQQFEEQLKSCATLLEAKRLTNETNRRIVKYKSDEIVWEDKTWQQLLNDRYPMDYSVYSLQHSYKRPYRTASVSIRDIETKTWYVNDLGVGGRSHIEENVGQLENSCYIISLGSTKEALGNGKECQDYLSTIGNIEAKLLSDIIGLPEKTKGVSKKAHGVYTVSSDIYDVFDKDVLREYKGDVPEDGYYVELNGSQLTDPVFSGKLGLLGKFQHLLDKPLYVVRKTAAKANRKNLTLLTLDHLPSLQKETQRLVTLGNIKDVTKCLYSFVAYDWSNQRLRKLARKLRHYSKLLVPYNDPYLKYTALKGEKIDYEMITPVFSKLKQELTNVNPLLDFIGNGWRSETGYQALDKFLENT